MASPSVLRSLLVIGSTEAFVAPPFNKGEKIGKMNLTNSSIMIDFSRWFYLKYDILLP